MKKLTKLILIGCLLMLLMNVGFATMQKLSSNITTTYAADNDGDGADEDPDNDCINDATGAEIAGCTPAGSTSDTVVVETVDDDLDAEVLSPDAIADNLSQGARSLLLRFSDLLSVILQMLNYLLWPILMMIGALMDNSIIFGGGMEDRLLQIWSQIRNIVNLLFVVILIGMALYNVLGIGEEGNYTIKKILPKFIIALIVVNFTFVASKVVLDAANVATNAVFALPNSIEEEFNLTRIDQLEQAVCGHLEDLGAYQSSVDLQGEGTYAMCSDESTFTANARQFFQRLSSNNIALVMAVNLGQIHEGIKVSELVRQEPTISNLTINILFSIIIYIVYAVSFIALFFVLLVRVVVLWLVIALSPFVAVAIVLPDLANGGGNFNIKDIFIKHVTAPIVIGFGMTVGYLMLDAYHATTGNALGIQLGEQFANGFSGMSTLQQLMIGIGAIAIVWVVTFQAAEGTLANSITRNLKGFVERTGRGIAQLPLTVPILPVPSSLNEGPVGLGNVSSTLSGALGDFNRRGFERIGAGRNNNNSDHEVTGFATLDEIRQNANTPVGQMRSGVATTALSHFDTTEFGNLTLAQARNYLQAAETKDSTLTPNQRRVLEDMITQIASAHNLSDNSTILDLQNADRDGYGRIRNYLNNDTDITLTSTAAGPSADTDGDGLVENNEDEAPTSSNT